MNRSEFNPLMGQLISAFPNARKSPEIISVYWTRCQDLTVGTFARVVETCICENVFMPSVGEILCMAEGRLTHERKDEREKAYRQMKARDSYATEADLVGLEPRKLISLEDCKSLGDAHKPKALEAGKPSNTHRNSVAGHPEFEKKDDDPPLPPEQAKQYIDAIRKKLGGVRPGA